MKSEEEIRKEFEKLYKSQKKKRMKEFNKLSSEDKLNWMKKELSLIDFRIEHTDFIITLLYQQQEKFLALKRRLKELIKNKNTKEFERDFL